MILNRLRKNYKRLGKWARKNNIEAYRLYERDIPEYPLIIDLYGDDIVIYDKGDDIRDKDKTFQLSDSIDALKELFPHMDDSNIFLKKRRKMKGKDQYERLDKEAQIREIQEGGLKFKCNLSDYLDTGLFLDHRPMRGKVQSESEGKKVLNLFCYTGSVSVYAASGGGKVTSVDMSNTYIQWTKENFDLNGINKEHHNFITQDCIKFLKDAPDRGEKYDLIFLDPPTFSNSKRMDDVFDVERDQVFLVEQCMKMLNSDGVLYFSNNKRKFKLDESLIAKFKTKDITFSSIPEDFKDKGIHVCFEIKH